MIMLTAISSGIMHPVAAVQFAACIAVPFPFWGKTAIPANLGIMLNAISPGNYRPRGSLYQTMFQRLH